MSPTFSHRLACPKCGRSRADGAAACARCGLVFANWTPGRRGPGRAGGGGMALDAQGDQLWDQLRASWQDEARHDAFLKHCATAGSLAVAGRRYRQRLDEDPQRPGRHPHAGPHRGHGHRRAGSRPHRRRRSAAAAGSGGW